MPLTRAQRAAATRRDPIADEMGPVVAGFLGFYSASRGRLVSKNWRRVLGADLARRLPETLQMYSYTEASATFEVTGSTFKEFQI